MSLQITPHRSSAYDAMVTGPQDLVGIIAYSLYKQAKKEAVASFETTNSRAHTDDEIRAAAAVYTSTGTVAAYRAKAEQVYKELFLLEVDTFGEKYKEEFESDEIARRLDALNSKIDRKTTFLGRVASVGENLTVNFLTILFIGAVAIGYKTLSEWNAHTDQAVGLAPTPAHPSATKDQGPSSSVHPAASSTAGSHR